MQKIKMIEEEKIEDKNIRKKNKSKIYIKLKYFRSKFPKIFIYFISKLLSNIFF